MKFDLKSKLVAKSFMCLCIIGGSILGNANSLSRLKVSANNVFYLGEGKNGLCISNDLNDMVKDALNIVSVAKTYDIDASILEEKARALKNSEEINEKYQYKEQMIEALNEVYDKLQGIKLDENHVIATKNAYTDFNSSKNIITHDPYNEDAMKYNNTLDSFPSNIMKFIHQAEKLKLFN